MVVQVGSPYADFAVFTPCARKTTRARRFTAYLLQPDGSWLAKEIPGPTNVQAWLYCWRVFRVACLKLKVCTRCLWISGKSRSWQLSGQQPDTLLFGRRQVHEHFDRLKSRIEFDISLGRAAPPMWDAGSPWSAIFLKAAEDDETCWDDNIRHPAMSWLAHGGRGARKSSRATGCGGSACRWYGGARPGNVSSSRGSELLGPGHFDQGDGTPEQEGKVSGARSRCEERSWAATCKEAKGQERRKGRKEQRSALHSRSSRSAVVFQLECWRRDVWRAFTGKPMSSWQSSQMHHVSVGQALGKAVSTGLTRSRGGWNWDSGGGSSIPDCARRRMLDFPALFFGSTKFGLGEAISVVAARRGIKVRVINRDILRDGTDLLADEPFSSYFTAALNGHFDGFHSGFPCSSFSRARFRPGGPPPVRDRQHLRGRPSNSRVQQLEAEKGTLLATRSAAMVRAVESGGKKRGLQRTATLENPADSWCRHVPECLVVARTSQYHRRTRRRASNPQHLLFWSSSLEGAMLGGFSSRSRSIRKEALLQGSACAPVYQKRPPEPHSSAKNMPTYGWTP